MKSNATERLYLWMNRDLHPRLWSSCIDSLPIGQLREVLTPAYLTQGGNSDKDTDQAKTKPVINNNR